MEVQHSNIVLQENIRLKRIVAEQSHIIEQLKEDKEKLKKEIFDLNDDVINSLRQERDDFLERNLCIRTKPKSTRKSLLR